jgi:hypothetical protein
MMAFVNTAYGPGRSAAGQQGWRLTQGLYEEAKKNGWVVISMKKDWKRVFAFEP